jgi:PEP-CTERM motif
MKTTIALVVLLLVMSGAARATTLEVTDGFLNAVNLDIGFDLKGNGFEIGPGAWSTAYTPASAFQDARAFFPLGNLFGSPPMPNHYVDLTLHQAALLSPGLFMSQTTGFTMTGTTGLMQFTPGVPPFVVLVPQADLVGQGVLTVSLGIGEVDYDYFFQTPEPSTLLLVASGIVVVIMKRSRGR